MVANIDIPPNYFYVYIFWLLLVFSSITTASAQNVSGSPYSMFGVGELTTKSSALNRSMSGAGIAVSDSINLNNINPASYTSIRYPITHIAELGFYIASDTYETNTNKEKKSSGTLTAINYWFRFSKRWGSTFGLSPYSKVSYNILSQRDFSIGDDNTYIQNKGKGGLNQLYLGNGYQITKNFSIGVNLAYIFGAIEKDEVINSNQSSNGNTVKEKTSLHSFDIDVGAQYSIPIRKNKLTFGFIGNNQTRLKGYRYLDALNINSDTLGSKGKESVSVTLPLYLGGGIAFHNARFTLTTDLTWSNWAAAKIKDNVTLQDTYKFSGGIRYVGNPDGTTYLSLIHLNSGMYYQNQYIKFKGVSLNSWGYTLGIGLPVADGRGIINLNYNRAQTGTLNKGLIRQRSQSITIDLIFRDIWGGKRNYD